MIFNKPFASLGTTTTSVLSYFSRFSAPVPFSQLNRASLSIAANIAEGNGRFTERDRKNFFGIARGSVQECVPLLELARRRRLFSEERHSRLKSDLEEISRMLSGLIKGLENREGYPVTGDLGRLNPYLVTLDRDLANVLLYPPEATSGVAVVQLGRRASRQLLAAVQDSSIKPMTFQEL